MNKEFSLENFRKWMEEQDAENGQIAYGCNKHIGMYVESKATPKKLTLKISECDDAAKTAKEFCKLGGIVKDSDGENFIIEVPSGTFVVSKHCVQRG